DAYVSVRVVGRDGVNDRGIALLDGSVLPPDQHRSEREGEVVLVVGIVDASQRIERISTDIESLAGQAPGDVTLHPVLDLVHPEDVAHALGAFDAATEPGTQTSVVVRARDDAGSWSPTRLAVARFGDGTGRFGFALGPADIGTPALESDRVGELEYRLRRIAREVEAAHVIDGFENLPNLNQVPGLRDLTSRQWEIITRLLRGERVPTIARRMYLSQSTIRNHLASVFRKVGVHSQPELLELLRAGTDQ
ncbi:MAG: hypothetical protein JOZ99_02260, partial [Actinobacteria bacterium]|nr:hypothetical protein [Actinomycetota bacterium]